MFRRFLGDAAGYSLVEVMASIVILSAAIIPMVGMFDIGLKSTTHGSNYDRARSLANLKLEEAKSLPYSTTTAGDPEVLDNFPVASSTPDSVTGIYTGAYLDYTGTNSADFTGFKYKVDKRYIKQPDSAPTSSSQTFVTSTSDTGLMRVTVTVQWDGSKTYATSALVSK